MPPRTPRLAVADDDRPDLTIRLEGIALDHRDTAEIRALLVVMRLLGFVPRTEAQDRPRPAR